MQEYRDGVALQESATLSSACVLERDQEPGAISTHDLDASKCSTSTISKALINRQSRSTAILPRACLRRCAETRAAAIAIQSVRGRHPDRRHDSIRSPSKPNKQASRQYGEAAMATSTSTSQQQRILSECEPSTSRSVGRDGQAELCSLFGIDTTSCRHHIVASSSLASTTDSFSCSPPSPCKQCTHTCLFLLQLIADDQLHPWRMMA